MFSKFSRCELVSQKPRFESSRISWIAHTFRTIWMPRELKAYFKYLKEKDDRRGHLFWCYSGYKRGGGDVRHRCHGAKFSSIFQRRPLDGIVKNRGSYTSIILLLVPGGDVIASSPCPMAKINANTSAILGCPSLKPLSTMMRLIWRYKSGSLYIPVTADSGALLAITVAVMRFRALI